MALSGFIDTTNYLLLSNYYNRLQPDGYKYKLKFQRIANHFVQL